MKKLVVCALTASMVLGVTSPVYAEEEKTYKIGMSIDTTSQPWRAGLADDVTKEAEKYDNVELTVTDAGGDTNKQISDVEDLITKGVDAILISPAESQPLSAICKTAVEAGIYVVVLDRELAGDGWTTFIGANNADIGAAAGEFIKEYMTENDLKNLVMIEGSAGTITCVDRTDPVLEAIEGTDINVVAEQSANWLQEEAMEVAENLLQANPEGTIDVIYSECDAMTLGVIAALKNAGRDDVKLVSIDGQKEALAEVKNGKIVGEFTYPFPGAKGVQVAMQLIDGEEVERRIDIDSVFINADNVEDYYDPDAAF